MKGLVLAGGKGTRLRPITYTSAKQLIPVAGKPILFYVLEDLKEAGIKDVGIVISPETGEDIKKAVKDGSRWGLTIEYILQTEPLGLAHAVKTSRDYIGNSDFVMYLGDNLVGGGIKNFVKFYKENKPHCVILLKEVDDPTRFGVAKIDKDGRVVELIEKPKIPPSKFVLVGVYIFSEAVFKAIESIKPSFRGELEITDAIQVLINEKKKVQSFILNDFWLDTGKKDEMLEANYIVLDRYCVSEISSSKIDEESKITGRVHVSSETTIKKSNIKGPTYIGENCNIENSYIGPYTSVGDGTEIVNSYVQGCVIMENCSIRNVSRMEDSLLGRNVIIKKSKDSVLRAILGDDSDFEF